jgi:hypothetical protein
MKVSGQPYTPADFPLEKKQFLQKGKDVSNYCEFLITILQNHYSSGGL